MQSLGKATLVLLTASPRCPNTHCPLKVPHLQEDFLPLSNQG